MIPEKLVYTPDDYREILFDGNGNSVLIVTDLNLNEQEFLQDITQYPEALRLLKEAHTAIKIYADLDDGRLPIVSYKIEALLTKLNKWS